MSVLRFDFIPYPLWRRQFPAPVGAALRPLFRRCLAAEADEHPPAAPAALAAYLARWGLLEGASEAEARAALAEPPPVEVAPAAEPDSVAAPPVRLPAQWEPVAAVLLTWPHLYPPLWAGHAAMVAAIAPAAAVEILVPSALWAAAARFYLRARGADHPAVRWVVAPVDDIWVRDYGPLVGRDAHGRRAMVKPVFAPLPRYPQARDDALARRWAALRGLPVVSLDLYLEGGNLWTDGAGTLIVSEHALRANRLDRAGLEARLRRALAFDKLVVTPCLRREETGHVDLLVKLADAQTVLVTSPALCCNGWALRETAARFRGETNAAGQPYHVVELPAPPPYLNWGVYPIWRSYTNALTVNGRVLVPVFGLPDDDRALAVYAGALPGCQIIPIDCRAAVNGGGAVHCLTRDVPA